MADSTKRILPLLLVLAVLLAVFGVTADNFLTRDNMLDLLQQITVNAIMAFGITLTILIGGIDLSVGAVMALVGTVTVDILAGGSGEGQSAARLLLALNAGLAAASTTTATSSFGNALNLRI